MLDRVLVFFRDFLSSLPLSLEVDGFGVPFLDGSWHSVHEHDPLHEGGGYSSGEVSNEDILVFDIGLGDMILKL